MMTPPTRRAHNPDQAHARWVKNGEANWLLKRPIRAGGAVLARVHFVLYIGYVWRAAGRGGYRGTANGAKRATRQALREAQNK